MLTSLARSATLGDTILARILGPKLFGSNVGMIKFGSKKLGSKIILCQKKLGPNNLFGSKKIYQKKIRSEKIVGTKEILDGTKYLSIKIWL